MQFDSEKCLVNKSTYFFMVEFPRFISIYRNIYMHIFLFFLFFLKKKEKRERRRGAAA